jgi:hypothetical protein
MGHPSARLAATIDWRFLENASGRSIRISPPSAAADAADGGLNRSKGGQFIAHVKALPGNPYDGHTLDRHRGDRDQSGACLSRIVADLAIAAATCRPTTK